MSNFKQFKIKRELWIQSLNGKDRNSIMSQIYRMIWNTAVFKVVNEGIKLASVNEKGDKKLNGMVFNLFGDLYFENQFIAIRRVVDGYYSLEHNKKGVCSLISLLDNMIQNISLLTRENYFKVEGLEYDYEIVRKRYIKYEQEQRKGKNGVTVFTIPDELDYHRILERHKEFDKLTNKNENNRTPDDCVKKEIFIKLKKNVIDATNKIKTYVEKYVAHAATMQSRLLINAHKISIKVRDIWSAQETICKVANFLDIYLLSRGSHFFLPVSQYNNFRYIENALVIHNDMEKIKRVWSEYEKETQSWNNLTIEEILKN